MAPVYSTKNRNLHRSRFSLIYTLKLLGCTKTGCLMIDLKEGKRKKKKKKCTRPFDTQSQTGMICISGYIANIAHIKTSVFKSVCSVYCVRLHVATVHASLRLLEECCRIVGLFVRFCGCYGFRTYRHLLRHHPTISYSHSTAEAKCVPPGMFSE